MFRSASASYESGALPEASKQFRIASFGLLSHPSLRSVAEMHLVVLNDLLDRPDEVRASLRRLLETQRVSHDFVRIEASPTLRAAFERAVRKRVPATEAHSSLAELASYDRAPSPSTARTPAARVAAVVRPRSAEPESPPARKPAPSRPDDARPEGTISSSAPAARAVPPTPAPAPVSNVSRPQQQRSLTERLALYADQARDVAFAIQVQLVCQRSSLEKAAASREDDVWFVAARHGGGTCWRVLWGKYATKGEAERAIARVPTSLRERGRPIVVDRKIIGAAR